MNASVNSNPASSIWTRPEKAVPHVSTLLREKNGSTEEYFAVRRHRAFDRCRRGAVAALLPLLVRVVSTIYFRVPLNAASGGILHFELANKMPRMIIRGNASSKPTGPAYAPMGSVQQQK